MSIDLEKLAGTVKVILVVVVPLAILAAGYEWGYNAAETKAEQQAKAAELESVKALEAAEKKAKEAENDRAEKVAEALAERDAALSRAASLRRDAGRVLERSSAVSDSAVRAAEKHADAGTSDSGQLAKCERLLGESAKLLGEGVGLSAEGAELSARLSGDKAALTADR